MKKIVVLATTSLGLLAACGRNATSGTKIYGGNNVSQGDVLKSTVAFRVGGQMFCSATIVSENIAISAAHCILPHSLHNPLDISDILMTALFPTEANLAFGSDAANPVATRKVVDVRVPAAWDTFANRVNSIMARASTATAEDQQFVKDAQANGNWSDISVIKFEGGLPNGFGPAKLSTSYPQASSSVILAGFGISEVGETDSGTLRKVTVDLRAVEPKKREITSIGTHGRGSCKGDSGGPMYLQTADGLELVGPTSRSTEAGSCQKGDSISTSVVGHLDFVKTSVAEMGGKLNLSESGEPSAPSVTPTPVVTPDPAQPFSLSTLEISKCESAKLYGNKQTRANIVEEACSPYTASKHDECLALCKPLAGI